MEAVTKSVAIKLVRTRAYVKRVSVYQPIRRLARMWMNAWKNSHVTISMGFARILLEVSDVLVKWVTNFFLTKRLVLVIISYKSLINRFSSSNHFRNSQCEFLFSNAIPSRHKTSERCYNEAILTFWRRNNFHTTSFWQGYWWSTTVFPQISAAVLI